MLADCKFKESDTNKKVSFKGSDTKHPNLGKAPAKKQRNTKTNASRPEKHASRNTNKGFSVSIPGPRCYICNQTDHLANTCPSKGTIKAGAQTSLNRNKSFMALWQAHSPTQNKNNVLLTFSNHGETIYAQHVWASSRRITDVILTT